MAAAVRIRAGFIALVYAKAAQISSNTQAYITKSTILRNWMLRSQRLRVYPVERDEHHTPTATGGASRRFSDTTSRGRIHVRMHRHPHPFASQRTRYGRGA